MNSRARAPCQGGNGRGTALKDGAHGLGEVRGIDGWHQVALFIEEVIKANPREGT